ncbi:MAG: caspase family protein [Polymorphobacter sp.]
MIWSPAPTVLPPQLSVQFGHDAAVDAAAWLGGDQLLVTAEARGMMVILWDALTGEVIRRMPMPLLGRDGLVNGAKVEAMTARDFGGEMTATISLLAYSLPDRTGAVQGERYQLTVDLETGRFAPVPPPQILPRETVEKALAFVAPLPVESDFDGLPVRLDRDGGAILVTRVGPPATGSAGDPAPPPATTVTRLSGVAKGYFSAAAMSPDSFRLVRNGHNNEGIVEVSVWDSRNTGAAPVLKSSPNERVGWIGTDRFFAATHFPYKPAVVADAATGRSLGTVPARCLMEPVGDDGPFVAAGPGSCGAPPSREDGIWFFERDDPAGTGFTLARHWQKRRLPAAAAREIITALTVGPSEQKRVGQWEVYAATRPRRAVNGVYPTNWLHVGSDPAQPAEFLYFFKAADQRGLNRDQMEARRLAVSRRGGVGLWAFSGDVRLVNDRGPETGVSLETMIDHTSLLDSDDTSVAVGAELDKALQRFDARTGARLASLPVSGVLSGGYLDPLPLLWAASNDGSLRFWDTREPAARTGQPANWSTDALAPLLQYYSFPGNRFFAALPDGRYDTNLGPDTDAIRWVMPHRPTETLPAQTFMRSRYEPDLVRRLMACVAARDCASVFPPLADVRSLNRAVPNSRITGVTPVPGANAITVTVATAEGIDRVDGPIGSAAFQTSGAHDLRLFVDGRLVRQFPDVLITRAIAADDSAWRAATKVCDTCDLLSKSHSFTVPIAGDARRLNLSAYAFNTDRIRGETGTYQYQPPSSGTAVRPRRTVVIAIGVDATVLPDLQLNFAVNDARAMVDALKLLPGRDVTIPILLTSTAANPDGASKASISAVLRHLNGFATPEDVARVRRLGLDPATLTPLTPDDVAILTFSGHGTTIAGEFYMVPADAQRRPDGNIDPASLMSSTELTQWARRVDVGDMVMVIDACHSAASFASGGFKPGPMGDPGLGQLAYDKGIRILAAAQSDDVALEDGKLGHGLLTYALVNDGLGPGLPADLDGDGKVLVAEWLRYGVQRLPAIAAAIKAGTLSLRTSARMIGNINAPRPAATTRIQQPALFDFTQDTRGIVLRSTTTPRP